MRLPHFPLPAVVFPHLPLPIHVFEERYRAMVRDAMAADSLWAGRFVVSLILEGSEVADPGANPRTPGRAAAVGTIVEVRHEIGRASCRERGGLRGGGGEVWGR